MIYRIALTIILGTALTGACADQTIVTTSGIVTSQSSTTHLATTLPTPDPEPEPATTATSAITTSAATATPAPITSALPVKNCTDARERGIAPLVRGKDAGYSTKLDRDGDGVACEPLPEFLTEPHESGQVLCVDDCELFSGSG